MSFNKRIISSLLFLSFVLGLSSAALAQPAATAIVRGHILDQTAAVIPGATITLTSASGATFTATSGGDGGYILRLIPPGTYTFVVQAPGFAPFTKAGVVLGRTQSFTQDAKLDIQVQTQQVVVTDQSTSLDTSPENNASAMSIKGKDLEALSDDPDELSNELQALAGPSAGPNGGQIYVDGFTGGQLPPKSSIREIRINQNPFSAQFDKLGYGRIEILTKPGTDKYHGQGFISGNASQFNTGNPFTPAGSIPSYYNLQYSGYVSGPIGKNASFFMAANRRDIQDDSIIDTTILDSQFNIVPFTQGVLNPQVRTQISPRVDLQIGEKNTLTVRLQYTDQANPNAGITANTLPSAASATENAETELQIGDTQILSDKIINETRFEYGRNRDKSIPASLEPLTSIRGAFASGGAASGTARDALDRYEVQNYTSIALSKNFIRFGGRLRAERDSNYSTGNYNGTFVFGPNSYNPSNPSLSSQCGGANSPPGCVTNSGIVAYQITQKGLAAGLTPAQIRANGGGSSQYSVTSGNAVAKLYYDDLGLYAEDDWKAKPNFTFSYGLRFETQTGIADKADFAPRIAMAWGIGGSGGKTPPKTVLRAGFGIFYDRFTETNVLQAQRQNGSPGSQQQFIVTNPDFFPNNPSTVTPTSTTAPTTYSIAPHLHAAYTMQTGGTLERTLSKTTTLALTYLNSRGLHQYLTENINAPLPGTYIPGDPSSGVRPFHDNQNRYQYAAEGLFNQNQLISNVRMQANKYVSIFGFYILNFAKSDTTLGGFPSNSYNIKQDYGNSTFDVRHRAIMVGNITLPHQINLSPFLIAFSGSPFNLFTGQDLNGDSIFNDRPSFASQTSTNVKSTPYGNFNLNPTPGETLIPFDYGRGPSRFVFNLRVAKAFGFGPKVERAAGGGPGGGPGGGGGRGRFGIAPGGRPGGPPTVNRKYTLNLSAQALNVFNDINRANPVGDLTSPQFNTSTALAGGIFSTTSAARRIYLQAVFSF